jgi:hypothetical protein
MFTQPVPGLYAYHSRPDREYMKTHFPNMD